MLPKPKLPSTYFPRYIQPDPFRHGKDIPGSPPPDQQQDDTAVLQEVAAGPSFVAVTKQPPRIFDTRPVVVPGVVGGINGQTDFNLPGDYEWVGFYFPTAPAATLSIGPGAPIYPVVAAGLLVLPFTTRNLKFLNTNAAAYTVYIMAGANGVERPSFTAI